MRFFLKGIVLSKIAFIGLGDMGQVIVPRIIEAGHEVIGWNRSPGKTIF